MDQVPTQFPTHLHGFPHKYSNTPSDYRTRTLDPIVTGTSVLAIKYFGGVLLSADTLASYGSLARFRSVNRLAPVGKSTLMGASGEYSDFQYILELLDDVTTSEELLNDGSALTPKEIYSYLSRVMYNRRNRMNPLWNNLVLGGFRNGKSFLGLVDLYGTYYEDDTLATGYGAHIARPLLRNAFKPDLSKQEAKKILEDSMRVLYYRDGRASNKIQIGDVSADGVSITEPYYIDTDWEVGNFREAM
eukprot:TRINITY_DN1864_c0_g1_i1.p1 TRINITY_DN1864_c0_g1~~TRINITY_DN1864_c0_g1_i1.p1  ORF type:complete len:246 (-),score=70.43 TRINITY_DN1864_c0_g1_i1:98-835(-)